MFPHPSFVMVEVARQVRAEQIRQAEDYRTARAARANRVRPGWSPVHEAVRGRVRKAVGNLARSGLHLKPR